MENETFSLNEVELEILVDAMENKLIKLQCLRLDRDITDDRAQDISNQIDIVSDLICKLTRQ